MPRAVLSGFQMHVFSLSEAEDVDMIGEKGLALSNFAERENWNITKYRFALLAS